MRPLPPEIEARLTADHIATHFVVLGGPPGTYRWTNYSKDLVYGGNTYIARPFALSFVTQDLAGGLAVDVAFEDQAQGIQSIPLNEGTRDRLWTVYEAWIDTDGTTVLAVVELTRGFGGIEWDREKGNAAAVAHIAPRGSSSYMGPRGVYGPACRFRIGDPRCGISDPGGGCIRTWTRCGELANQARFGGFRRSPAPGSVIRWGRDAYTLGSR